MFEAEESFFIESAPDKCVIGPYHGPDRKTIGPDRGPLLCLKVSQPRINAFEWWITCRGWMNAPSVEGSKISVTTDIVRVSKW